MRWNCTPGIAAVASSVVGWQLLAWVGALEGSILPSPIEVAGAGIEGIREGFVLEDMRASLFRLMPGLFLGATLGGVFGVLTGRSRLFGAVLGPLLHVARALPTVALIPIYIQFLGISELCKILIVTTGVFFPVWLSSHQGALQVPREYLDLSRSLNLGSWRLTTRVVIPATLPFFVAGVRVGIGYSYVMVFISEWVGATSGVGYRLALAHVVSRLDLMVFCLAELGLLSFLTDAGFHKLARRALPWSAYTNE